MDDFTPTIVSVDEVDASKIWIHDKHDRVKASILTRFFDDPREEGGLPRPFGIFYQEERHVYESGVQMQIDKHIDAKGLPDLDVLLEGPNTWSIK